MTTSGIRKVYSVAGKDSGSKGITLPKAWVNHFPDIKTVYVVFNDNLLLIFPDDQRHKVEEMFGEAVKLIVHDTFKRGSNGNGGSNDNDQETQAIN